MVILSKLNFLYSMAAATSLTDIAKAQAGMATSDGSAI